MPRQVSAEDAQKSVPSPESRRGPLLTCTSSEGTRQLYTPTQLSTGGLTPRGKTTFLLRISTLCNNRLALKQGLISHYKRAKITRV